MDKEFDEEAQLQAVKDNEEFFKKIENQSHNFIKGYTALDYMQDQYRKIGDMSNTQEDENASGERKKELDGFSHIRLEALKLAVEMVRNINHFEPKYDGVNELLKDVDVVHEIAESNFKYIIGEK